MATCWKCGNEIREGSRFCANCGSAVADDAAANAAFAEQFKQEKEFLDNTHRLLRWEQKAWRIGGIVFTIMGAVFGGLFLLLALLGTFVHAAMIILFFIYALLFGGMFLAIGIVSLQAAKKIPYYLDTMHKDLRPTVERCGSVGMLIFAILFNTAAMVFFIINFTRIKNCTQRIEQIIAHQK